MTICHRLAKPDDITELGRLNYQLIKDEGHRNPMDESQLADRMADWMAGDYTASVFEDKGRMIAYALYREDPEKIYLRQFFVDRESRRSGIGRACMEILLHDVWPAEKRITLDVLVHNTSAISFWREMGFTDYCIIMERRSLSDQQSN